LRRLPPGPHGLPPELVERNQRERLIAAMAEVCAERGYAESSVAEIAKRAGVSTASFYRQFEDRRACMMASFEELFGRLLEAIEGACPSDAEAGERVRVGAETVAALLGDDLPTARLLSVEIIAVGPPGVRAQHEAIERLASLVVEDRDAPVHPDDPAWAAVAACTSLIARRSTEGERLDAAELQAVASRV
jgi:AcrR family transcriptional regulator